MQIASYSAVRHILFHKWDPLGVGENPKLSDEYDRYVPEIARMVNNGTSILLIAERLGEIEKALSAEIAADKRMRAAALLIKLRSGHLAC
jgi:hypothetical protein